MFLSEAIKQLESLKEDRKSFLENDTEHDEIFLKDIEAIDTVLHELKKLNTLRIELQDSYDTYSELTDSDCVDLAYDVKLLLSEYNGNDVY